ncbi:hypothetical protein LDENG_00082880 [Lucifuga dentata]|nr:hypothetical protein LDENG_00082880 [Lucifuga dentata]
MCSVAGCESWRQNAKRFNLPEDPERRLEWVQFLAEINGQCFKESSWTDITICSQHFTHDCFENSSTHLGLTGQLKSNAVPSICLKSEEADITESEEAKTDEPEVEPVSPKSEPVEAMEVASEYDQLEICDSPTSCQSSLNSVADQASPVPNDASVSFSAVSCAFTSGQTQQPTLKKLAKEKAALLQMKGKYVVNEKCLLQLFRHKCPLCRSKCQLEKITHGLLIVLKKRCLQCEYRRDWKSQAKASVPTAEGQHQIGETESTAEGQQTGTSNDNINHLRIPFVSEVINFSDEENDPSGEGEEVNDEVHKKKKSSKEDAEWNPPDYIQLAEELAVESDEEIQDESEEESDSSAGFKANELCTECGCFFNKLKPHTCVYKTKPYSCNICGKRCVTEHALQSHSKIHDETYRHLCKYCLVTFKTRVDKLTHEQTHQDNGKCYQCPKCPETFRSNRARQIHMRSHKNPNEVVCEICGAEFSRSQALRRHLFVHTGLKPFKCSECQRAFSQASHLKSHMRLHTGERPFKCKRCDKSFNHNVSLKSHVERYHTAGSGHKPKKDDSNSSDDDENKIKRGKKLEPDSLDEAEVLEEERRDMQISKKKSRSTGRPRGRPKRNAAGGLVQAAQAEEQGLNTQSATHKARSLKRKDCSDDEFREEQNDGDQDLDSAEEKEKEEEEKGKTVIKSTGRSKGKSKNADSDSDYDPVKKKGKKKNHKRGSAAKTAVEEKGGPKKDLVA